MVTDIPAMAGMSVRWPEYAEGGGLPDIPAMAGIKRVRNAPSGQKMKGFWNYFEFNEGILEKMKGFYHIPPLGAK